MAITSCKSSISKSTDNRILNNKIDYNIDEINKWKMSTNLVEDIIPYGFYSKKQLMKLLNIGHSQTINKLNILREKNLLEEQSFKIKDRRNRTQHIPYYKLKT